MDLDKNISLFVESQFPAIYKENGAELMEFAKAYYKWMETDTSASNYNSRRMFEYRDIATTSQEMIIFFQKKFLADLPLKPELVQFAVRNILDLYRSKGTEQGLKLFFRMFYEADVNITYPASKMLKVSASRWKSGTYLQLFANDNNFVSASGLRYTYADLIGRNITGSVSGSKAAIDKINTVILNGIKVPLLFLDRIKGTFEKYESIITNINGEQVSFGIINGSLGSMAIDTNYNGTTGNNVGDILDINATYGNGGKAIVTKVSEDFTGEIDYNLVDGGWGYTIAGTRLLVSTQSLILANDPPAFTIGERLTDTIGTSGVVVGQDQNSVGIYVDAGVSYSLGNTISTVDRNPNVALTITGVTLKNTSSPGPLFPDTANANDVKVESLDFTEEVSVITDPIAPHLGSTLQAGDWSIAEAFSSGLSPVNLSTTLDAAFDTTPFTVGRIVAFENLNPGSDYTNDVFSRVIDTTVSQFEKRLQIITLADSASAGFFKVGELISQATSNVSGIVKEIDIANGSITVLPYSFNGFDSQALYDIVRGNDDAFTIIAINRDYNGNSLGDNAIMDVETQFAVGRIEEVAIWNSGFGYVDAALATLTNFEDDVQALGKLGARTSGKTSGYWSSFSSHVNGYQQDPNTDVLTYYDAGQRIQDSDYYQEYSYLIKSLLNPTEYEPLLLENVHIAGTKVLHQFLLESKTKGGTKERFIRYFNDDGKGSIFDQASLDAITTDIVNFTVDQTALTADNVNTE